MDTALAGKQNTLTFDNVPTQNSDNPVKSGGVYSALANTVKDVKVDNNSCVDGNGNAIVEIKTPTAVYEYTISKVDNLNLKVTTEENGTIIDEEIYNLNGTFPVTIDNLFNLSYLISGY